MRLNNLDSIMATSTATSAATKPKWSSSIFGTYPSSNSVSSSSSLSSASNSSSSSSSSSASSICSPFLPSKSDINNKISKSSYCFGYSNGGGSGGTRSSDNNNKKSSYSFLSDAINNNHYNHHHHHNHYHQNNRSSHYGSHSNLSNSRDKLKLSSISNNNITGSGAKTTSKCKITKHEFVAHGSAVTCLALGQKSGRVMVTGGDDAKINLWAIGKPNCIMSLNGHRTSIECAKFNHNEDIVGAGSASGAIKLWDLEAAKLIQTLTGHKTNVRCLDFHPYGQFLASGSFDTSIKLWDYRKKGCIFTYKVHSKDVHCLKLSPDGRWLASGGNEGSVMLYDIVAGKMLSELKGHSASVTDVVFHPNEFLLTSSSSDGTVKFWDLESFQQVSTTNYQSDVGPIRKIAFHPEGKALLTGAKDILKVYGWEPTRLYDSLPVNWSKLNDMAVLDDQLIAGTYSLTNVSVYMVDITTLQPFNYINSVKTSMYSRDNVLRQSTRRNFNFDQTNKTCKQLESLESNRTDDIETLGSDGDDSLAEIYNACDYKEIFQSRRELNRTPPPLELPCSSPSNDYNLRSLPETTLPHSYSISSLMNKSNGNVANIGYLSSTSTLNPSVRHLSESLSNIHLINKNNNNNNINNNNNNGGAGKLSTNYTNSINNNHLISPNNVIINNNNNLTSHNGSSSLAHATSLTALNHPKSSETKPTFPIISPKSSPIVNASNVHNSLYNSPSSSSPYNSAITLTPLNGHTGTTATSIVLPSASVSANIVSNNSNTSTNNNNNNNNITGGSNVGISNFQTPTKITSVVRPVINDTNRPTSIAQPQPKIAPFSESNYRSHNTLASLDTGHNEKSSTISGAALNSPNCRSNDPTSFIIPDTRDHSAGLDFNDFLPKHIQQYGYEAQPSVSEMEAITTIVKGHKAAKTGLDYRRKQVQIVLAMWATKDSKTALEYAVNLDEKSIIIDILNVMILKSSSWNLDICLIMLPCIQELLESKYESYMSVGCSSLSLILKTFSSTIKNNISAPPGIGVDISREERYNKCMKCYNYLLSARAFVLKRQTLQGKIGRSFRELSILMQNLD